MNPELKQSLNLPPLNWDRILKWSVSAAALITFAAFLTRGRTFLIIAQFADVMIVLGLLGLVTYAVIARYTSPKSSRNSTNNAAE